MNKGMLSDTPRTAYTGRAGSILLLALAPVFFLFVAGCESSPPPEVLDPVFEAEVIYVDKPLLPVTSTLIGYMGGESVSGYQYYISNQVVLLRENSGLSARNVGGSLELTNASSGEQIIIEGSTPGVVVNADGAGENITALDACFEPGADNLTLRFIRTTDDSFDLEVLNGMVRYGGEFYRLTSAEKPVKLLVNLKTGNSSRPKTRTAPGRLISALGSSGSSRVPDDPLPDNTIQDAVIPEDLTIDTMLELMRGDEPEALRFPAEETRPAVYPLPPRVETARAFRPVEEPAWNTPRFTGKPEVPADPGPPVLSEPLIDPGVVVGKLSYIALPSLARTSAPSAGQNYWIQVGSFEKDVNAQRAYDRLSAAGFSPAYERRDGYCRVIIPGVAAEDVAAVKRRLDSAGFRETLVREAY